MRDGLTPKREKFAQAIASGASQADAYRAAYSTANMSTRAVHVESGWLAAIPAVSLRIAELRAPVAKRAGITLESHLEDLLKLRNMAAKAGNVAAAITAEVARGKHAGVAAPERREHSGAGGAPIHLAAVSMTPAEFRALALEIASKT
jgi:phage terminase small subunit